MSIESNKKTAEQVLDETVKSQSEKDGKAMVILGWAEYWHHACGYDAVWVYKQAIAYLEKIGLSYNDFLHFERRIAHTTEVNE